MSTLERLRKLLSEPKWHRPVYDLEHTCGDNAADFHYAVSPLFVCLLKTAPKLLAVVEAAKIIDRSAVTFSFLVGHIPPNDLRLLNQALAELEQK